MTTRFVEGGLSLRQTQVLSVLSAVLVSTFWRVGYLVCGKVLGLQVKFCTGPSI